MAPHSRFDPSLYPRVYRVSREYRVFLEILAEIAVVGGSIAVWSILWGPETNSRRVSGTRSFYDAITPGTGPQVCVDLRLGAWHIPWYVVNACR